MKSGPGTHNRAVALWWLWSVVSVGPLGLLCLLFALTGVFTLIACSCPPPFSSISFYLAIVVSPS